MEISEKARLTGNKRVIVIGIAREMKARGYTYQEIRTELKASAYPVPSLGFLSKHLGRRNAEFDQQSGEQGAV